MAQQTRSEKKPTTTRKPKTAKAAKGKQAEAVSLSDAERFRMIAEAAYLKAESRGFEGGNPTDDWLQAELEVDARFSARH